MSVLVADMRQINVRGRENVLYASGICPCLWLAGSQTLCLSYFQKVLDYFFVTSRSKVQCIQLLCTTSHLNSQPVIVMSEC